MLPDFIAPGPPPELSTSRPLTSCDPGKAPGRGVQVCIPVAGSLFGCWEVGKISVLVSQTPITRDVTCSVALLTQ